SRTGRTGAFNRLGVDAVAGHKVWDDQSKFRVRLGPLAFDHFRSFLPGGRLSDVLVDLVRYYVRGELDFDVQVVLKPPDVPRGTAGGGAALGGAGGATPRVSPRGAGAGVSRARR